LTTDRRNKYLKYNCAHKLYLDTSEIVYFKFKKVDRPIKMKI